MNEPINISNYFATLNYFTEVCKKDRRLNPASQLLFRLLAENANRSRWTATFTYKLDDFEAVTGLPRETIRRTLQKLKNLGWIDFTGKPSKYTVYNPLGQEVQHSGTPTPPVIIQKYNTKEKNEQKRKEERPNDANPHDSRDNRRNLSEAAKAEVQRCLAKFNRLNGESNH